MIKLKNKANCTGCTACKSICPQQCIMMLEDQEGFNYPFVDNTSCIDCSQCEKICPVINTDSQLNKGDNNTILYAAYSKDETIRRNSSSGGIFTLLAKEVLKKDGRVYGASFDENFNVVHSYIKDIKDIHILQGSKYVQSVLGTTFEDIKLYLKQGGLVLFCGTPCQVAGLRNYVGDRLKKNLYLVDFICHGVPSPKVWNKYLKENKNQDEYIGISFRKKKYGWKTYSLERKYKSGKVKSSIFTFDTYMQAFLRDVILRPSCYKCFFRSTNHLSDITLADYWEIKKVIPNFNDDKGVSKVMVHTEKGEELFNKILFEIKSVFIKTIQRDSTTNSVNIPKTRKCYFECVDQLGIEELHRKFVRRGAIHEIKTWVKGCVKIMLFLCKRKL